jgi:cytochrome P450
MAASSLLGLEGEDHTRIRRLVSRSFTPRAADAQRPIMRELVNELVAGFAAGGHCEFMTDFSDRYPVQVIAHLMGVAREDWPLFARWGDSLTHLLSLELFQYRAEVEQAQAEMGQYLTDLVADRRANPRDDLVSELIAARDGSDRLNDEELMSLLGGLLFAGYDTTRNQLGLAMAIFADRPDQWKLLADQPDLAPAAVEEIMRFRGAVGMAPRFVVEAFDMDGYHLPAGTMLSLSTASANHDPSAYQQPDELDITAAREPQLTFGGGPHYCLGASLARAEMQEALPMLARSMPDLALDGEPTWRPPMGIFGPETLPIRFGVPAGR